MKSKKNILLSILLVMALLLPTATVSAKNEKTFFTIFAEVCEPGIPEHDLFVGQGNYIALKWPQTCTEAGSIPEVTGIGNIVLTNLHALANGVWMFVGKAQIVTEVGAWDMNCVYQWPSPDAKCQGNGEGAYEGMQIFMTGYPGYMWTGYIVDR